MIMPVYTLDYMLTHVSSRLFSIVVVSVHGELTVVVFMCSLAPIGI